MVQTSGFFRKIGVVLLILLWAPWGIPGAESGKKIETLKKKVKDINRKIKKGKADIKTFARKENEIINSLNQADRSLSRARRQVAASRADLAMLEKKIRQIRAESESLTRQIGSTEDYASGRMVALYKLGRLGKMNVLASADSVTDFFQRKIALERILAYDQTVLEDLSGNKATLQKLLADLNARKKKRLSLEATYKAQIKEMADKRAKRSELLTHIRGKKSLTLASIKSLKQSEKNLDQKIKKLMQQARQRSEKSKKMSSGKFSSFKGLLKLPVKGKITGFFGSYKNTEFDVMNFRSGIDIKAKRGEPIHAVCAGRVLYASWFKGYGNMLIIDHGNHYCTLYAHTDKIFKKSGDAVEAGEVIGTVGDTGSMKGSQLHFQVRHHGESVDPVKWLKKG